MSSIADLPVQVSGLSSSHARRERVKQALAFALLGVAALSIAVPAVLMVYFVAVRGLPAITWEFLTTAPRNGMTAGGIWPAILGSVYLVLLTLILAVPVGVLGAVYLSEYAHQGLLVRLIRLAILNLAGVPSIVYGLFGMGVFVMVVMPAVLNWLGADSRAASPACLLSAAATLALLVLPVVITTAEEALRQVPQHQRNASLALGATRWQTVRHIVLPNALPGILTGLIMAVGRAAGETAPILLTGAVFYASQTAQGAAALLKPFMALPYHVYAISTQLPNAPEGIKWGTALVLLVLVLGFNILAIPLRSHLRRGRR
jgi:phosphate transport system permease protein